MSTSHPSGSRDHGHAEWSGDPAFPPADPTSPVEGAVWPPLPASALYVRPAREPRRGVLAGAVVAAAAFALAFVIVLVATMVTPAAKKHGGPPAPPRATSSASGQARAPEAIQPLPGRALSVTATATLTDPDGFVGIAFGPDGTVAASSENDDQTAGHVDTWNSSGERRAAALTDTNEGGNLVNGMAFSPKHASTLAVADLDGVDVWNLDARNSRTFAPPDTGTVTDVAYAPDGKTLAECDNDGYVYLLDTATGHWLDRYFADPAIDGASDMIQVTFSPDGKTLAAADADGTVWAWRRSGGAPLVIKGLPAFSYPTQLFAFSPDSRTLAVAYTGGVQLWDLATRTLTATLGDGGLPDAIAFSPNGTALAVGDGNGGLNIWDLATGQATTAGSAQVGWTELEFSPDSKTLAALDGQALAINLYRIGYPASSPATQFL